MVDRDLSKRDFALLAGISANTMTKLNKTEDVSMSILNKICSALDVNYGDIIEYVPDDRKGANNHA